MHLHTYTDPTAFETLRPEWNALVQASASHTLFLTWEWQATWWATLGVGHPHIFTVRDDAGHLLGIAPLYGYEEAGRRILGVIGGVDVTDYLDLIVRQGYEDQVYPLIFDHLTQQTCWDELLLCNIPSGSASLARIPALAQAHDWRVEDTHEDVCPVIALPADWDAYLASLNKHQRHEVRRKLRRIQEDAQYEYRVVTGGPELESAIDNFFTLHRLSHHDKARFMDDRMAAFFRTMIHTLSAAGHLELSCLYIDGHPAATMLNFRDGDRLLVYNSGYDPAYRPNLSSGIVLLSLCIQDAIQRGLRLFDFLQGNEEYKYRFGAEDTEVRRLTVTRHAALR